jgi:DNA-binding transcriptional ArsR family regulator
MSTDDPLSRTFAALADPTRRALLARLTQGPASVGELAAPFDMSFAAVSKHLRVLENAGLVSRGRDAQYRPATLDARPLAAASAWISNYRRFWADSFDALGDYLTTLANPLTNTTTTTTPTTAQPTAAAVEPTDAQRPSADDKEHPDDRHHT